MLTQMSSKISFFFGEIFFHGRGSSWWAARFRETGNLEKMSFSYVGLLQMSKFTYFWLPSPSHNHFQDQGTLRCSIGGGDSGTWGWSNSVTLRGRQPHTSLGGRWTRLSVGAFQRQLQFHYLQVHRWDLKTFGI